MYYPKIPAFNHMFTEPMPYACIATASIKQQDTNYQWKELFKVTDSESAWNEVTQVIEWFNETRKEGENARELVAIVSIEDAKPSSTNRSEV